MNARHEFSVFVVPFFDPSAECDQATSNSLPGSIIRIFVSTVIAFSISLIRISFKDVFLRSVSLDLPDVLVFGSPLDDG